MQIPRLLVLQRGGVIDFNLEARPVNIELLSVRRYSEGETRTAGHLGLLSNPVARQIERPELAAFGSVNTG